MSAMAFRPAYLDLLENGQLDRRAAAAYARLKSCDLCPWQCRVDRTVNPEAGICLSGGMAVVASFQPGFGEETPLTGRAGSGLIFFASCNLHCDFCHNARISQSRSGQTTSPEKLAAIMLHLQSVGCPNINLVTPTHMLPFLLAGVAAAVRQGLRIPLVYNTSGYERVEILAEFLDGVVDIYLPDLKFFDDRVSQRYMHAPAYPLVSQQAVEEMQRQVGDLRLNARGLAERGMIIRHLVLPGMQADTCQVLRFIAEQVSPRAWVSLLHYRPSHLALNIPPLDGCPSPAEYQHAVETAAALGLRGSTRTILRPILC